MVFVVIKVDPYLLIFKTMICVVYVDDCLFWECSQSNINKVMKSLQDYWISNNWAYSKGEPVYEFLCIDINTLDDGWFQFYQTGLIRRFLGSKEIDHCNGFPTPTKIEAPPETCENGFEDNIDWPNSYAYVIVMMLYLESNKRPYIYFLLTSVPGLLIPPMYHIKQLWRGCVYISKLPMKRFWCLIHPKNWWWIFMLMQTL